MSIVSSTESRTEQRTVYMPPETGMAHRSYLSPDRKQVLVVEMGCNGVAALPVGALRRQLSRKARRPGAGAVYGRRLVPRWEMDVFLRQYRQRGLTSGGSVSRTGRPSRSPSASPRKKGFDFAPDGRSFVTSIGTSQSTVWVHDSRGDRQMTSEGYAFLPSISPDGKKLYYLVRAGGARNFMTGGLWVADLESGQRQRLLPDFQMQHYTISADGQRVVFVASDDAGRTPVWLASLNGRTAPRRLTAMDSVGGVLRRARRRGVRGRGEGRRFRLSRQG